MQKRFSFIITLLLSFISCDGNPCIITICSCEDSIANWVPPTVRSVYFSPKTAKIGDTIMIVIEKDAWNCTNGLDYNKDFEITGDGKIKYIGTHKDINSNFPDDESRMRGNITKICSKQDDNASYVEVTEYVSIQGVLKSKEERRDVVLVEFIVPANAKSGYIWTTDPMGFARGGYSDERLIIVDENGKEITE